MPKAKVNGITLYYEVSGDEDAFPIVWHGHGHKTWAWQQLYFSEYYYVITYDRRGTGMSDNPPGPWNKLDLINDVLGLLDYLGVEKTIMGGSSLGAGMSLNFAMKHLDRVAAIILNAGAGCGIMDIPVLAEWYEGLNSGRITLRTQPKSGWWQQEYNLTTNPAIEESRHGGYYLKLLAEAGKRTPKDAYHKMLNMVSYPIRDKLDRLKEVGEAIPVLQMMGGHECQGEILAGYELHKHIPNSEFILNPECWHAAPREHPEHFNWIVHEWLKRHGL